MLVGVALAVACGGDSATEPVPGGPSGPVDPNPDRAARVALYQATDGPNWTNSDNWLTDAPLGDWYGVQTSGTSGSGRVVSLVLDDNALAGPIPPELGNLTRLELLVCRGEPCE